MTRAATKKQEPKTEPAKEPLALTRLTAPTMPWVDEYLADLWKSLARTAAPEPRGWVDAHWHEDAVAALRSAVDDALAEHKTRAEEYDEQERVLRGQRKVKQAPTPPQHVPLAVVTKSGFWQINSKGDYEASPMDEKPRKALDEFLRLHAEQDGTPQTDPGPGAPAALPPAPRETDPAGPGSPQEDNALDKATDDTA